MALAGDKSFLMPLWKTKLLKMNQQRLNPRSWEEDEGASYNFPEDLGVVPGVWPPGQQGPRSLTGASAGGPFHSICNSFLSVLREGWDALSRK